MLICIFKFTYKFIKLTNILDLKLIKMDIATPIGLILFLISVFVQNSVHNKRARAAARDCNDNRASRLLITSLGIGMELFSILLLCFPAYILL